MRRIAGIGIAMTLDELVDALMGDDERRERDRAMLDSVRTIAVYTFLSRHADEWNRFVTSEAVPALRRMCMELGPDHLEKHGEKITEEQRARIWTHLHHPMLKMLMLTPAQIAEHLDYFNELAKGNPIKCMTDEPRPPETSDPDPDHIGASGSEERQYHRARPSN